YAVAPDGTRWHGARGLFERAKRLPGLSGWIGRIGALPPPSLLAEPVYRLVARHRMRISRWVGRTRGRLEIPRQSWPVVNRLESGPAMRYNRATPRGTRAHHSPTLFPARSRISYCMRF